MAEKVGSFKKALYLVGVEAYNEHLWVIRVLPRCYSRDDRESSKVKMKGGMGLGKKQWPPGALIWYIYFKGAPDEKENSSSRR